MSDGGRASAANSDTSGEAMPDWRERYEALPDHIKQAIHQHGRTGMPTDRPGVPQSWAVVVYDAMVAESGRADLLELRRPVLGECIYGRMSMQPEPGGVKCPHTDVCPECWTDGSSRGGA